MKKVLILLLLGSFSIQLTAMVDGEKPSRKRKIDEIEVKEQEEQNLLNEQLLYAVFQNNLEWVKESLEKGANLNIDPTILIHSIRDTDYSEDSLNMLKFLIENLKDLNAKDKDGLTAIHSAAYIFYPDLIDSLINAKANINCVNKFHDSPLMHLFKHIIQENGLLSLDNIVDGMRYLKSAKTLADHVDINTQDLQGNTALMLALEAEDPDIFECSDVIPYLVEKCNASLTIKNNAGETAVDIAKKFSNEQAVKLLENKLKQAKELQAKIKKEILDTTPLPEALAELTSEYLEGSKPIIIQTV